MKKRYVFKRAMRYYKPLGEKLRLKKRYLGSVALMFLGRAMDHLVTDEQEGKG